MEDAQNDIHFQIQNQAGDQILCQYAIPFHEMDDCIDFGASNIAANREHHKIDADVPDGAITTWLVSGILQNEGYQDQDMLKVFSSLVACVAVDLSIDLVEGGKIAFQIHPPKEENGPLLLQPADYQDLSVN